MADKVPIILQLHATMDANGNVEVTGNMDNKVFAYGLLEAAKDAIDNYITGEQKKVQPAGLSDVLAFGKRQPQN